MRRRRPSTPVLAAPFFLALVLAGGSTSAAASPAPQQPPRCDGDEYRQFDFWIGDWRVETPDGRPAGTNRIESVLRGCVLMENWEGRSGSIGTSFNMYNRRNGKWQQTWVDGSGSRLDLVGGLVDGRMVLSGTTPTPDGGETRHEITWQRLASGRVKQHWRTSQDGGATWTDAFVGIYVKK